MKKYKNCLTYGTYDLFHKGHERLLLRIAAECENLYVGVSSDKWNEKKGKISHQPEDVRLALIKGLDYVDEAFYEDHDEAEEQWLDDYKKYNINTIIMGSDHEGNLDYLRDKGMNIEYLPRTEGISSTELKEHVKQGKEIKFNKIWRKK